MSERANIRIGMSVAELVRAFQRLGEAMGVASHALSRFNEIASAHPPVQHDAACDRFLIALYRKPRNRLRNAWRPK